MKLRARVPLIIGLLSTTVLVGLSSYLQALQADIRTPSSAYSITVEYANTTSSDQTMYLTGDFGSSYGVQNLPSGSTLEVTKIDHVYPMAYSQAKGLTSIDSSDSSTKTGSINPSDATFVNSQNQLSFVLTPTVDNKCAILEGVRGCIWDTQKLNSWNYDTLSCLGGAPKVCAGDAFSNQGTTKVGAGLGGKFTITVRVKGTIEKEQLAYFPLNLSQVTPSNKTNLTLSTSTGVSVLLTERATAAQPKPSNSISSSSTSSSQGASSVSTSQSVSSSTQSTSSRSSSVSASIPVVSTSALSKSDIQGLDIFCKDGVVGSTTTCSFTLPNNKILPPTFRISIGDATSVGCVQQFQDVTCNLVPLPLKAQKTSIFVTINSEKIDTLKKVSVVAVASDLIRTGTNDTIAVIGFAVFGIISLAALVISTRRNTFKKIRF